MIAREQMIVQSTEDFLTARLFTDTGYSSQKLQVLDSFQDNQFSGELDKNYVASGFTFDDGGRQAELGSNFRTRLHTIEFVVMGVTAVWGENLSAVLVDILDSDGTIPLLDIGQSAKPEIDRLVVEEVQRQRGEVSNPEPWQRYLWVVRVRVRDEYYHSLLG